MLWLCTAALRFDRHRGRLTMAEAGMDTGNDAGLHLVASRSPLAGLRLLIVDDDESAREALETVLTNEGATVVTACSGVAALDELDDLVPDVMLVDLGMPIIDGFTLTERLRLRSEDRGGAVPVAALTGYMSADDRERAFRSGVQAYLLKPVDLRELVETVKALARGPRQACSW
jgi:CheY-like chemotaxis protein